MAMVSAVQEAQKDNVRSFNDYMMTVLEVSVLEQVHIFYNHAYHYILYFKATSSLDGFTKIFVLGNSFAFEFFFSFLE